MRGELFTRNQIDVKEDELGEFDQLKDVEKCNILVLRISDFAERKYSNKNKKKKLYTQAVFTFYIDSKDRVPEEKLRLLLLLRKPLSKFLKNEISTNTFLELLNLDNKNKVQSDLKHDLRTHTRNISTLRDDIIEEKVEKLINDFGIKDINPLEFVNENSNSTQKELIFNTINQAIASQIGAYELDQGAISLVSKSKEEFHSLCKTLVESAYIAKRRAFINKFIFKEDEIVFPKIVFEVILIELIINMKKHSPRIDRYIKIEYDGKSLTLTNNYDDKRTNGTQKGIHNCKNIITELRENNYEISIVNNDNIEDNIYSVSIKLD